MEKDNSSFANCTNDILKYIFAFLDNPEDLYNCRLVCKRFYKAASHDSLWAQRLQCLEVPVKHWNAAFPPPQWIHLPKPTLFAQLTLRVNCVSKRKYIGLGKYLSQKKNQWFLNWLLSFVVELPYVHHERHIDYQAIGARVTVCAKDDALRAVFFVGPNFDLKTLSWDNSCPPRGIVCEQKSNENFVLYVNHQICNLYMKD